MTVESTSPAFAELGLSASVLQALDDVGYESPSPIQATTIPPLLAGRDLVGLAQTGTGKTAAFALPILSRIDLDLRHPQALVLAPTRELALQVSEAFERYASHLPDLHVLPVYGGQAYGVQLSALRRGVHVIVGTPGRIMDHLDRGTLDLSGIRYLVLDEADEMLRMGFAEDVESILSRTPDTKQVALFSATMQKQIRRIAGQYLSDPVEVAVEKESTTASNIRQRYLVVAWPQKVEALTRILEVETFEAMIVFVRTKQATEQLAERLRARGFSAAAINGDIAQVQRERTIGQLRDGSLDILVATDVAARGLDVERISHVVNFDIPTDTESYVHRIGRTGRAGRSGDSIAFVTPRERHLLRAIEKATRKPLEEMGLPSVDDINSTRLAKFDDAITRALSTESVGFFRDVVEHYVNEYDVPEMDVAAALAVVLQGDEPLLLDELPPPPPVRERGAGGLGDGSRVAYRISVGRRQNVNPGQIVGALANEGGLRRDDFGKIDIRSDHSLVQLPADLPASVFDKLRNTRISGQLIELTRDTGRRPDSPRGRRPERVQRRAGSPEKASFVDKSGRKKPRWDQERRADAAVQRRDDFEARGGYRAGAPGKRVAGRPKRSRDDGR